jgi:hypothetical protein
MSGGRKQLLKFLSIVAVVALLASGVALTATAAPGPRDDVKTAQYGGGGTGPKSGPCKGRTGAALQSCKAHAEKSLKKALAKCKKKHTAAQRAKCKKAAHKKWDT